MILKKLFEMIKSIFAFDLYEIEQELIAYLSNGSALPKPLDTDEEQFLIDRLPDEEAKSKLIEHNLRLVVYIAKKFENSGQDIEDLISVGAVGLIKAVQSFNNEKNIKLATYASRCIENEILMHLRKTTRQKLEISLDEPLSYDKDGNELLLSDILVSDEESVTKGMENSVEKQLLKNALKTLPPKEQEIINLRFGLMGQEECTQKQVADILGISQSYISRIEKKILLKLRRDINKYS